MLAPTGSEALLARGIEVHFEGVSALAGVDVDLRRGEILGLIGPNGAGKTTLVNVLTGFQCPDAGSIRLGEREMVGVAPHRAARRGIARTFQTGRSFRDLTVAENVEVGAVGLGIGRREARRRTAEALDSVGLSGRASLWAGSLASGEERRLQVARALAMRPSFLFLDEPAAGLNESESDGLMSTISELPERLGCGVLVIDHDMRVIMGVCHRIQVLDHGVTISVGTPADVRVDPAVITAYLGSEAHGDAA